MKKILKYTFSSLFSTSSTYDKPRNPQGFQPLINSGRQLMLSLSSKSGSVFGASWFFFQMGLWPEIKNYHQWVHKYRQNIYYPSTEYETAYEDFSKSPNVYTKIKLVRDPYSRAVSSYIHTLKHPHLLERDTQGAFKESAFSFETFLDLVNELGSKNCNPHYRTQTHNFERTATWSYDRLIKLENSIEEIQKLEREFNLKPSPTDEFRESKHHSKRSKKNSSYVGNIVFSVKNIEHSAFPYFYNKSSRASVKSLYAEDFENYDYTTTLDLPIV